MALDNTAMERKLKAQEDAAQRMARAADPDKDNAHLFEEFKRPPQPGEAPKPRGLNAAGYQFPPPSGPPALTKENLAKGVGLPPSGNAVPPLPPASELVTHDPLFEEYQRPDLKSNPRTGTGLRPPPPRSAKEILQGYEPPTPQVFTGKRPAGVPAAPSSPTTVPSPAAPIIEPVQRDPAESLRGAEADAADLDAAADLASAPNAVMSHSRAHGPTRTVTDEDPFALMPNLPRRPTTPASAAPHASDAPAVEPGDELRIALVQADFNYAITTRMADAARRQAEALGSSIVQHAHVSGAFDIAQMAKALAARADVDAVIAIGCIVQGETGHDQVIAQECARKLADLAYDCGKPIGLAVTGPRMTRAAAEARAEVVPRHAVDAVVKQWRALKAVGAARAQAR